MKFVPKQFHIHAANVDANQESDIRGDVKTTS